MWHSPVWVSVKRHHDVDHELRAASRQADEKERNLKINVGSKHEDLESVEDVCFLDTAQVMEGEMRLGEGFLSVPNLPAALRLLPPP